MSRVPKPALIVGVIVVLVLVALGLSRCGGDDDSSTTSGTTTTTSTSVDGSSSATRDPSDPDPSDPNATTTTGADGTPGSTGSVGTTATTEAVSGERFTGTVASEEGTVAISFVRTDDALRNVAITDLVVPCLSTTGGEERTETVDFLFPSVPIDDAGMVDHTDLESEWRPALSGSFNDEGRFLGGLFVNRQGDGEVCGGDFPVDLAP